MCHYAEVLKGNLVDDKKPTGHAASPGEPVTSKPKPLQHTAGNDQI